MAKYSKWGDDSFEVLTFNNASQRRKAGVFIFAGRIYNYVQDEWVAYYIGETSNFETIQTHPLWRQAKEAGATDVHICEANDPEKGLLAAKLILIYKPQLQLSLTRSLARLLEQTLAEQNPPTKAEKTEQLKPVKLPPMETTMTSTEQLSEAESKLQLLYQYERHYLELIKEYKEEIKFANALQEDLRRERSHFFTQTLKEVAQTMKAAEVDKTISAQWIQDLVDSYTKSIDLSSDLAKTHVVEILSILTEEAKHEASKAKLDDLAKK